MKFLILLVQLITICLLMACCSKKSTTASLGNGYLIITLKKGTYLNSNTVEFRNTIGENMSGYDSIQKKYYRLTGLVPTDTLDAQGYDLLRKALKFDDEDRLYCIFSLVNIDRFYNKLYNRLLSAMPYDSSNTDCTSENLGLVFGVQQCTIDSVDFEILKQQLAPIAEVRFHHDISAEKETKNDIYALTSACTSAVSHELEYHKMMKVKNNLWEKASCDYGSHASIIIVESQGAVKYKHCEFSHKDSTSLPVINLGNTVLDFPHSYYTLGIVLGNHQKKNGGNKDCLGIVPKVNVRKIIIFDEAIKCSYSEGENVISNNSFNAVLSAFDEAKYGDVVLFAWADGEMPIDHDSTIRSITSLATKCLNIIVVEAAGNGSKNISSIPDSSLAIVVGAAEKDTTTNKISVKELTNYGTRITCFAPGDGQNFEINVPKKTGGYILHDYTSAASAIMAATIVGLQSRFYTVKGRYFTPNEIMSAIKKCNISGNGQKVEDNNQLQALDRQMPYTDKVWDFLSQN